MKIDVNHIATLSNLPLSPEEKNKFAPQLEETLTYMHNLNTIPTEGVSPTSQVTGLETITAEDIPLPSLSQKEALQNASHTQNGYFVTQAILE